MSFARLIADLTNSTSVPAIEHEHLQEACLAGDCHVIDVREPNEYQAGHIPHAINHPLSRFDPAQLPADKPVVLVCQAGGRSARALQAVIEHGRKDVVHYAGGTGGWRSRGGAIVM
ncbi:MAG: rhodanese-like domain-containing protein [Beijerinckiaceae bacterium]|nr:rhodanese-like domain-containing protein [Beijerinckiaceae bacterium]